MTLNLEGSILGLKNLSQMVPTINMVNHQSTYNLLSSQKSVSQQKSIML